MSRVKLPETVRVYVGEKLNACSDRGCTNSCAFANALSKKLGRAVYVSPYSVRVFSKSKKGSVVGYYNVSRRVRNEIRNFDSGGDVKTGHYRFKLRKV